MTRSPIESSMMMSVAYDKEQSVLEIEFRDGDVYEYRDVPELIFRGLLKAPSKGSFFHRQIESKYRFAQIGSAGETHDHDTDGIPGWPGLE